MSSARSTARDHHARGQASRAGEMLAGVRASGLKLTPQRMAIVREIANDPTHPTAQELYERLLPAMPTMSFATVYNTLDALAHAGLCSARALSPGPSRFDPNMAAHDHAVCERCGLVRDVLLAEPHGAPHADLVGVPTQESMTGHPRRARGAHAPVRSLRGVPGFSVRAVEQIYRGLCDACGRSEARAARGSRGRTGSDHDKGPLPKEASPKEALRKEKEPPREPPKRSTKVGAKRVPTPSPQRTKGRAPGG